MVSAADGSLVLAEKAAVPAQVRVADLGEDHEGHHSDSLGWQVGAPYRTTPPAGFDAEEDEVWLDAAALRARVLHLLAPAIDAPVSGGHTPDALGPGSDDWSHQSASCTASCSAPAGRRGGQR